MSSQLEDDDKANSHHGKRPRSPAVWLDLLPVEVCSRISSMLPQRGPFRRQTGMPELEPLKLAAVSSVQRRAVAISQDFVLRVSHVDDFRRAAYLIRSWHNVLGNDIREVCLSKDCGYRESEEIHKVLSLPSVVKATMPYERTLLKALYDGGVVKRLEVQFTKPCRDPYKDEVGLADVLRSCAVEELRMVCFACSGQSRVPCYTLGYKHVDALIKKGPSYTSLRKLALLYHTERLQKLVLASVAFPNLDELYLELHGKQPCIHDPLDEGPFHITVSSGFEKRLPALRSVGIINYRAADELAPAPDLGESMTAFAPIETVSGTSLEKLERCPNLEYVNLVLAMGAEAHFPTNLCSLRSLSLSWAKDGDRESREGYYSPRPDVLMGIIRRNKQLKELRLQNASIPHALLEDMLMCLGDRVRSLQLPVSDENPHMLLELLFMGLGDRVGRLQVVPTFSERTFFSEVERMARLFMKYNPNVVDLWFGPELSHMDDYFRGFALREPCKRVEVLMRRLPQLSETSITKLQWLLTCGVGSHLASISALSGEYLNIMLP